ncbi:MAG: YceI family protein, partial [Asticcacaulis sp.]|nr:YceI family protein [Asticcacaulis sp.]
LAGRFDYDPANWRATRVLISVDPRSLRAQQRDWTLASFEPDKYPVIRYASTQVLPISAGRGRLAGDLTLHGVTRPVTLDFVFSDLGTANDLGAARMAFSGSGRIRRSDFGLAKSSHFAGDEVDLLFEVEFLQATARARAQFAEGRAAKP